MIPEGNPIVIIEMSAFSSLLSCERWEMAFVSATFFLTLMIITITVIIMAINTSYYYYY